MPKVLIVLVLLATSATGCIAAGRANSYEDKVVAFPGAEGYGRYSQGGRGGRVLRVTSLEDDGPGTLRDAVQENGPRTIVFDVSGYIDLRRELDINNGYVTIAGQTAPGDGITLRNHGLNIKADHVIVRFIRSRPGAAAGVETDAISITRGRNIIVDHCSTSWATDETLSVSPSRKDRLRSIDNVTVQWSIIAESLNNSVHSKGEHGYGSLLRGNNGARYTLHNNLWAHHRARMPRPGNYLARDRDPLGPLIDIRNNVFFNWGGRYSGYNVDKDSLARYSLVGNRYLAGPDSTGNIAFSEKNPHARLFFSHNSMNGSYHDDQRAMLEIPHDDVLVARDFAHDYEIPISGDDEFEHLLDYVGASLTRDSADRRIIADVQNGTGGLIDDVADTPGWPQLLSGVAPKDSDGDGMPDYWERAVGLSSADASDGSSDSDSDGYTNLEDYLNSLVPPATYRR